MKSDVYFVPVAGNDPESRSGALEKLLGEVAHLLAYKQDELVPVKLTIGDSACVYHLRPQLVRQVVSKIKDRKARPFLFDTNVIYKGQRQNAFDHLTLAEKKGFGYLNVGAPFVVADGILGQDGKEHGIGAKHIKKVKVPSFVGMLDSLLVLTHATGHVLAGYAGAIKNVAMGMSCRPTKQVQHSSMKPSVIENKCTACGGCVRVCPVEAIIFSEKGKAWIEPKKCIGCGECLCACQFDAVFINWEEEMDVFCSRMVEVANFILSKFKNKFFITFAFDITQECDCISTKDDKFISRNIGILASQDIVSLDQATADLASDDMNFFKEHGAYKNMLQYAQKLGLGSLDYRLIKS